MTNGGDPEGRLDPGQTSQPFMPRGRKPWTITFTNTLTGEVCTSPEITNAGAKVTITSWDPCDFRVDEPGGGNRGG